MKSVGAREGKTNFECLVDEAERGETIIITRHGRPVAQLCPIARKVDRRSAEEAFAFLIGMDRPLGADVASLLREGHRG